MAWYKNGQITVQSGSRTVLGSGTAWQGQVLPGEGLDVLDGRLQEIAEVISNTELLLVDAYAGAAAAGVAYQIIPSASMTKELTRRVNALIATHEQMTADVGQAYTSTMENAAKVAAVTEQVEGDAQAAAASAQSASDSQAAAHADSDAAMGYRNEARAARDAAGGEAAGAAQANDGAQLAMQQAQAARDAAGDYAQSINPVALRDRSNHTGTQAIATVAGLQAALDQRVLQTAAAGAALLPEGGDAQRPAVGSIPAGYLPVRGNTQDAADYKPEFWDRVAGAWRVLASRTWVLAKIQELIDVAVGATYIYPNGGSQASPATVAVNSRYVLANPFPGLGVICEVQLQYGGAWGGVGGFITVDGTGSTTNGFGILARQHADTIVVQTGSAALMVSSAYDGNPFGITGNIVNPLPCRVRVNKVKG